jgi:hypothetical protein
MSSVPQQRSIVFAALFAFIAVAALFQPIQAQVLYGTLVGTVEDPSRAAVPEASVKLASPGTGLTRETSTDVDGRFQFTDVHPGAYTLTVSRAGFRAYIKTGVEITINTVSRVDVQLEVGAITEAVTVAASAAVLQTDKADVHTEIGSSEVGNLPLPAYRNYQSLINLVPGATPARTQNATIASPGRALATHVNGTPQNNNNNRLDGTNNVRATLPHQAHYIPPVESIETVNVSTNNFDADQGFAGGAAVAVVTKSGTNEFHGVVFENHRNSALQAKDFFYRDAKPRKNIMNMFGGVLGGPIKKDKLFFLSSWERMMEREAESGLYTIPTADQRTGDLSLNVPGAYGVIYDPMTGKPDGTGRTPFAGNLVPLARQSAITRKLQALIPAPNQPGVTNNYFASKPMTFNRDCVDAKVNWAATDRTAVWGKYSVMHATVTSPPVLDAAGGPGLPWGAGTGHTLAQLVTVAGTHTFSPTMAMDMNLGFTRFAGETLGWDYGKDFGLGIPGTNGPDIRQSGMPIFTFSSGYTTLGQTESWIPKILYDNSITYNANLGWNKGAHDIRIGVDLAREMQNHWHPEIGSGPRGGANFDANVTALNGGAIARQYNAYAAFLLGLPQSMGKSVQVYNPYTTTREWREALYFRDRWQATRNLTISLGLRWEYYPTMVRKDHGIERYDPATNKVLIGGLGGNPNDGGTTNSKRDFAPRIGIAYRLGQKAVIRTGYGISIDPYLISASMLTPYPAAISSTFVDAQNTPYGPYGPIEKGFPEIPVPDLSSGVVSIPAVVSTGSLEKGPYRRGYVQSFNFIVQRELPWNLVGSVGYVGTRSVRQLLGININAAQQLNAGTVGRPLYVLFGRSADTTVYRNMAGSTYDSLQATLDRRFTNGVSIKTAYTWGKAINLSDDSAGGLTWLVLSQFARNRAVAGYDRTHNFRFASVAELPFGAGKRWANQNPAARMLLGGWQVNGIFSAYSGLPFTVTSSSTKINAPGNTQTADQVKSTVQKLGGIGPGQPFFDTTAFAPVNDIRFGTSGRNILRGPGVVNLDAGLFRQFRLSERWRMQFRAESLNLTNTPHFANPDSSATSATFMIISSTSGQDTNLEGQARTIRFALRVNF